MQRQIAGTLDVRFVDRIQQDILEHRNDTEYDILYLTPVPDSTHDFRVRIEDFQSLDLDNYDQWSQRFRTAYAHIDQRHPLGVPFIVTVGFFLSAALVQGASIPNVDQRNNTTTLDTRAGNDYRIAVYQNGQCTGEAIPYSGDDEDCHNGLGDGGAGLQLLALDADGMLVFYGAADCPAGQEVDTLNPNDDQTGTDCKPLNGNPVSFQFIKV
ncbi:unnamed protein product [Penicillium salamii]|uniref:Uncharacterized protein n=1 Tax=Penicillium salamii TaxID=1612424 RepID=A0A9W4NG61_9EURO|nr:unnamed protein product [Penicillium salamii]CAG8175781.1 unnamed protein product [Penicillium salamii]CAG8265522.1 unnamed protein product [Penicillium salamii]CAG8363105.1 unnamed protein product [Penicillium salamii]CAG8365631.1 unnamed protein product [Penicillium salamii]